MSNIRFVSISYLIWRVSLVLILEISTILPYRLGQEFTNILSKIAKDSILGSLLLYPWANFDGVHYLSIASIGYTTEGQFFPLYPLLVSTIGKIFGSEPFGLGYFLGGLIISNLAFFGSLLVLYKLLSLDFSDRITKETILFLLIFPTSFFFASIYSESLFLLLLIMSFYFARKKRWFWAIICGILLTSTRLVGVLILPALLVELLIQQEGTGYWNKMKKLALWKKALPLSIIITPLIAYSYFNYLIWGDALYFIKAHGNLANGRSINAVILLPQTIWRYFNMLTSVPTAQFEWWIVLLEFSLFIATSYLLFLAWKNKIRVSYLVFSVLAFLVPVSSGTFSGLPRYILILFPIFIVLALIKNVYIKLFYFVIGGSVLMVLLALFSRGYYIS